MSGDTLVDMYCHIYPDRFFQEMNKAAPKLGNIAARLRNVRKIYDLDARFREMDEFGDYRQVISLPNSPIEDFLRPARGWRWRASPTTPWPNCAQSIPTALPASSPRCAAPRR